MVDCDYLTDWNKVFYVLDNYEEFFSSSELLSSLFHRRGLRVKLRNESAAYDLDHHDRYESIRNPRMQYRILAQGWPSTTSKDNCYISMPHYE
ncbi:unnamed protein product [Larinioides sclopetarius]|uniref:Uncharacterized protein n=1 Tax=Larinioides sclopetarius TaxID=280406 RepID=A0AAV2A9F6_9ARAC